MYRRATLSAVKRVLLAAAMSSCSVLDHLLRYVQITRARSRRAVAIASLLSVVFDEAVRRRRAASTKLIEQRTESMLVFLLPDFGSRVAGGMRHWLHARTVRVLDVDKIFRGSLRFHFRMTSNGFQG